ncbi:cyclic beta 1-2 glucan synthetase [Clostridium polyendosporum]|uniref:Cyclic beta 1-2 glucan synthetase n=1 Tax=Clostridium polyendosporum TaxID=69208 RepID=A0A919RYU3_9CLOT|nr:glucoamylase family protein [Clostridium polyendosporum]GIM28762.1 cyclic beta 1-2 glucan synthetase [Clostridium polyendosporum]
MKILDSASCRRRIIYTLKENYNRILNNYEYINSQVRENREIVTSAEWLLDNIYLIEKEYKTIKINMPWSYFENLPLVEGENSCPRVYVLAKEYLKKSEGFIEEKAVIPFLNDLDKKHYLTLGELWAFPLMLRVGLIEGIGLISEKLAYIQKEKRKGEELAYKIIHAYNNNNLDEMLEELSIGDVCFSPESIEKFIRVLRDNSINKEEIYSFARGRMKKCSQKCDKEENTQEVEDIIIGEHLEEGKLQIAIGNYITSLRTIDSISWRVVFQKVSRVEKILKKDPQGTYPHMDFTSKDYYRHRLEEISRRVKEEEWKVAEKAIQLSELSKGLNEEEYKSHVGYYLMDSGTYELEKNYGYFSKKKGASFGKFIILIFVLTLIIEALVIGISNTANYRVTVLEQVVGAIVVLIPITELVIGIINWSTCRLFRPSFLPKLEYNDGIPDKSRTVVVIPAILSSEARTKELIDYLEVYYLANRDNNLYFALLGDFKDSHQEREKGEDVINQKGLQEVRRLNLKYFSKKEPHFYFFNRKKRFNLKQNVWMGWERKRGKLMEFMSLLRGDKKTSYSVISSDIEPLTKAKYIITLDADTILPMGAAKKMICAMSHILNKPIVNEANIVLRGYGVMQPKIGVNIQCARKTLFSRIFAGDGGIDIYSTATSDTYQDLFGEGIFTGKGILDIDVFLRILKEELPENKILSHDLLEGEYTRCALLTDVELVDGYPAHYKANASRLHRWVRGDWQLIPWLFSYKLGALSKWKIFDNIRRSLVAPWVVVGLFLTTLLLTNGEYWSTFVFLAVLSIAVFAFTDLVITPKKRQRTVVKSLKQIFLTVSFLPNQCILMIDAIIRTVYRLSISKTNLLEWQTAEDVEANCRNNLVSYLKYMWGSSLIGIAYLLLTFNKSIEVGVTNLIIAILWILSPLTAYVVSKEDIDQASLREVSGEDHRLLRELSRRTWAYYEDFVNDDNNYLAPDNFQEDPNNGVAYRTSPTNIAMGLVSNLVAHDLGYLPLTEVVDRIEKSIDNMETLEKYHGHFLNWYDTRTKRPLWPRYVSTVDSGNLVGYLWVIEESLKDYIKAPLISIESQKALIDTITLVEEEISDKEIFTYEKNMILDKPFDIKNYIKLLKDVLDKCLDIEQKKSHENLYWVTKLKKEVVLKLRELAELAPWCETEEKANKLLTETSTDNLAKVLNCYVNESKKDEKIKYLEKGIKQVNKLLIRIEQLKTNLEKLASETDFKVLYNSHRKIFAIGYDMENETLGSSCYDLLASEARAASFVAIAKGDVEYDHWFKLGRAMTTSFSLKSLVSWSGTMFEYFMPALIMKCYEGTLWDVTYRSVIAAQKKYAHSRKIPWGISESAYYHFDAAMNYQYKAFGVPGIGLKRGLVDELVVSPYSTVMALPVEPKTSLENIRELSNKGMMGRYGFYEALDYTQERVPKGRKEVPVKCFMVHHQGMILMALDNFLKDNILQERFHRRPQVKAYELLLQEKPYYHEIFTRKQEFELPEIKGEEEPLIVREYGPISENPETLALSNGTYSTVITNSGSGISKKGEMTVYRWKGDSTQESGGMFFYLKNLNSNEFWSATFEPCRVEGEADGVQFTLDKALFTKKEGNIESILEVAVSNEDNAEIRRITLKNHGEHSRVVEVTSYMEVTLAPFNADIVHPTFSNLFIISEYDKDEDCVIVSRRPRAKGQKKPHLMQTVSIKGEKVGALGYETSRINFIGRNRDLKNPKVMDNDAPLENTTGIVLDPIISMRARVEIPPRGEVTVNYITAVGDSKEEVIELAKKYKDVNNVDRVFISSLQQAALEMRYLGIKSFQANLYQSLTSHLLFLNTSRREREEYIKKINKHQRDLWPYGISGDLPIVLLLVKAEDDMDIVRQVVTLHYYWRSKGVKADLVIYNDEETSYDQPVQRSITEQINTSASRDFWNKPGGIYLHSISTIGEDMKNFLLGIARVVINSEKGTLINQLKEWEEKEKKLQRQSYLRLKELKCCDKPRRRTAIAAKSVEGKEILEEGLKWKEFNKWNHSEKYNYDVKSLDFFNGYGGFKKDGSGYVIILRDSKETPTPWINVISNGNFGFHISESGSSYTWCGNSRENKITPWNNDWVMDSLGEALYIRDNKKGEAWSLTPKPLRDEGEYVIEHGFGYSRFTHNYHSVDGELTAFCPMKDNVKLYKIVLTNKSEETRELSLYYYAQMVLGVVPQHTAQYISSYIDSVSQQDENKKSQEGYSSSQDIESKQSRFIWAQNPYSTHFGNLKAYLKLIGGEDESFTGDRREFVGRREDINCPLALKKEKLSNLIGGGLDPCLASCIKVSIPPNSSKTVVIALGQDESLEEIREVLRKYSNPQQVDEALEETKDYWKNFLGKLQVKTPDKSLDYMVNGWLMYQTLSCRYWARTAFYQSGGAYGFRDQLQDSMSLGILNPAITREQILKSASRQYEEGDVQHWWHPIVNSGIRTRFSDDLLWLPYVVAKYIKATGDWGILEEEAPYLFDAPLSEGEDERYGEVNEMRTKGTIYDHCIRALNRGLRFGKNNIPLMGSGDWNDGMSTVGNEGKGESIWLGWFLYDILGEFQGICSYKKDEEKSVQYEEKREFIRENLEKNAWDGGWYRRAYFDDGTPLGSMKNDECQIDSLAQSWAAITGGGKPSRVKEAMEALEKHLVKEDKGIILLLSPPFNNSRLEPGYIKGYVPGVRENGGQYTHAAIWAVLAFTKLELGDKAWRYFNMINPINHSSSELQCNIYKVEPYVMTADIYVKEPHGGRGGWSWYTGASGWMYKTAVENILGFNKYYGKGFTITPCIPEQWKSYEITYKEDNIKYHIVVKREGSMLSDEMEVAASIDTALVQGKDVSGVEGAINTNAKIKMILVDGKELDKDYIPFEEGEHEVIVII